MNDCPLCDYTYENPTAPQEDIDVAVAIHLDLHHSPLEILKALRAAKANRSLALV